MIAEHEKEIILQCAKNYNVYYILLFGSSIGKDDGANDIDLGVRGIEPKLFFKFYAELVRQLSKPNDKEKLKCKK